MTKDINIIHGERQWQVTVDFPFCRKRSTATEDVFEIVYNEKEARQIRVDRSGKHTTVHFSSAAPIWSGHEDMLLGKGKHAATFAEVNTVAEEWLDKYMNSNRKANK